MSTILLTELFEANTITEATDSGKKYFIEGIFMQSDVGNRNGRIYPKQIMEREVKKYNESHVLQNRAMGELNHPCFSSSAMALTEFGWKYIKDVSVGEYVYSLNIDTNEIELNKVKSVEINNYTGDMLLFKNRTLNTLVTPYHNFLLSNRNGKLYYKKANDIKENIGNLGHDKIPKIGNFTIENDKKYIIKGDSTSYYKRFREDLIVDFYSFCGFLGIYLSEGHTTITKDGAYVVCISQNEGDNANIIRDCLSKFNVDYKESKVKKNKIVFRILDRRLGIYLKKLGNCYSKYIPEDVLSNLDTDGANYLLDMFIVGDGRGIRGVKYTSSDCFSTSKRLRDDLSLVAFKAGSPFRLYQYTPNKDVFIEGRLIKKENKSIIYFLQILRSSGVYLDNRHLTISNIKYDDNVYCLSVENNNNFYVLDNEYSFWTGNCNRVTVDPREASHLITELRMDGANVYGKAKVIDTPTGKIVKTLMDEGIKFGVSSRALGSVRKRQDGLNEVQSDFDLRTIDIVSDPSAPSAWVTALYENKEWVCENGIWTEKQIEESKSIIRKAPAKLVNEMVLKQFEKYLKSL